MNGQPIDIPCDVYYDEIGDIIDITYLGLTVSYPMVDLVNARLYLNEGNFVNEKLIFATKRQIEVALMDDN